MMQHTSKKWLALAASLALAGVLVTAGCGGSKGGSQDTLKVGVTNFADSLEPTTNYFGWQVMRYGIGECLVHFDDKCIRSRGLPSRGKSPQTRCPGPSRSARSNSPTALP